MAKKWKCGKAIDYKTGYSKLRSGEISLSGEAEGVAFLGAKINPGVVKLPSFELEALRFLQAASDSWKRDNPGKAGISNTNGMHRVYPRELVEASENTGRPIKHWIRADSDILKLGVKHPENKGRLVFEKVLEYVYVFNCKENLK